jgi:hypothetical protein
VGWQTESVVQLIAGNTIINSAGNFVYSGAPAAGNLAASLAPASGTDIFGNNYLAGVASYGTSIATVLGSGFITFYTGSLAGGWSNQGTIETSAFGDIAIAAAAGREVLTTNNVLDDGAGGMAVTSLTVNGSGSTGSGNNGGVTSGPSGTVNAFPAAGPNHTHAEIHQHPF